MGFFSKVKNASGYVVNFKVTKWAGLDQIKDSTRSVASLGRNIFIAEQANYTETFEEAMQRLNITEHELQARRKEFTLLMFIYLFVALAIFSYSIYVVAMHKNFMGFMMGFAITIYALTHVFKYHFWIYQIKHKKLGCTLREWFLDIR
jgi:intracellular multiplication protein IcmV